MRHSHCSNLSPICLRHHDKDNLSLSQSKQEGYLHNYYNLVIYEKVFVRFCRNYCLRVKVINSLLPPPGGGGVYSLLWPIQEHAAGQGMVSGLSVLTEQGI